MATRTASKTRAQGGSPSSGQLSTSDTSFCEVYHHPLRSLIQVGNNVRANAFPIPTVHLPVSLHSAITILSRYVLEAPASPEPQERHQRAQRKRPMLIPIADVPRWYAERKPKDTIAVSHGADAHHLGATRAQRQPPRAGLCREGRQARRFRRHRAAQQQCAFRDHLCGVEMRRDADVADLAGCRAARPPRCSTFSSRRLVVGGQPDWNAPNSLPADFVPDGLSGRTGRQSGGALLEGDDQRRLDRAAEGDPRSPARRDRYRRTGGARHAARRFPAQPRPALPQRALHRFAHRAVPRRTRHRPRQIRRRGMLAPDRGQPGTVGQFRAHHDAPDLGAARRGAQPLRLVEPADRVSHGRADAAMAEGKNGSSGWGPSASTNSMAAPKHRAPRSYRASNGSNTGARSARSARPRACASSAKTATRSPPARPARSISCPMTAPAAPITISAPSRSAARTAGNRSAISAGSMRRATSISATASPT